MARKTMGPPREDGKRGTWLAPPGSYDEGKEPPTSEQRQGNAKSTLGHFTRRLLDPSVTLLRGDPRDARDLMIAAHNGWLVGYDNLSDVPPRLTDAPWR